MADDLGNAQSRVVGATAVGLMAHRAAGAGEGGRGVRAVYAVDGVCVRDVAIRIGQRF